MKVLVDTNVLIDYLAGRKPYYEDADSCGADYIVTRNTKDFENSKVPAITPEKFLKLIEK